MPWKVTRDLDQRIEFVMRALNGPGVFSQLCEEFGVSRPTGYKWLGRYLQERSVTALQDKSRRPRNSPGRTERVIEDRVVKATDAGRSVVRVIAAAFDPHTRADSARFSRAV